MSSQLERDVPEHEKRGEERKIIEVTGPGDECADRESYDQNREAASPEREDQTGLFGLLDSWVETTLA